MAKGKAAEADVQEESVVVHPHPSPLPQGEGMTEPEPEAELVTVVAVERLFVAAEARYVEPGETVMLPELTAMVLVEVGAAARVEAG